ncbi:hypothetical protein [Nocardia sp. NBC_01327]|uniref:hypothetical protein n=1 Tax=Nocardia sp. NBC_01327 TaxID=2903593 RepID=UPI002E0EB48E|nr:hypothetical protein OG326_10610 [Nocardia sp. NBC_01327]
MHRSLVKNRHRWQAGAAALLLLSSVAACSSSTSDDSSSGTTSSAAASSGGATTDLTGGQFSDCFWHYGAVGADPLFNVAYPDAGTAYWAAYLRRPEGSKLDLNGTFPHSRYSSLISYDKLGAVLDGVADYQMTPAPGSTNPFVVGARRDVPNEQRAFTLSVDQAANYDPATNQQLFPTRDPRNNEPQRNSLYTGTATQLGQADLGTETGSDGKTYQLDLMLYRVYIPDKDTDLTGGVGLPKPSLTLADGTKLTGQALCDATDTESKDFAKQNGGATRLPAASALGLSTENYSDLRYPDQIADSHDALPNSPGIQAQVYPPPDPKNLKTYDSPPPGMLFQTKRDVSAEFPGVYNPNADLTTQRSTLWTPQYDRTFLLQTWTGNDAIGAESNPPRTGGGGFFPNVHNNYIRSILHRGYGDVAVVKGKMPTHPSTFNHDGVMGTGDVRYISFCMNESPYSTRVMNCTYDEQVPVDQDGNYQIVISRKDDRPKNATTDCGYGYVEWSANGDGYKDHDFGMLQIRNMLPDTGFDQAVQNTKVPGDEVAVMGPYLPNVSYSDKAQFESQPCHK